MKPLCFVLMPFGRKPDSNGRLTDFDAVYQQVIAPAVTAADMEPIRADEEKVGGTIHKPMFERLMLCDYAVADVTGANPNVYYELGIRHAIRPRSTVVLFAEGTVLPFDIALLRGIPYRTDASGNPTDAEKHRVTITEHLRRARMDGEPDSPMFQFIGHMPVPDVDHAKTDLFRERVEYSREFKNRLAAARKAGLDAVRKIGASDELKNLHEVEAGIVVDLFLSYRAVKGHQEMVDLYHRMPPHLQQTRIVQEQLGFALNRLGRFDDAERTLKATIEKFGPSSETNGLLGRVYKDRWEAAKNEGRALQARGFLKLAIEQYTCGFKADWRDPYPGINAVTLMELSDKPDPAQAELLPVVRYAALERARANGDYWDHATLLELAVIGRDIDAAADACAAALAVARESWEPETTARNLGLIRKSREARGEDTAWIADIERELAAAHDRLQVPSPAAV